MFPIMDKSKKNSTWSCGGKTYLINGDKRRVTAFFSRKFECLWSHYFNQQESFLELHLKCLFFVTNKITGQLSVNYIYYANV